MRNIVPGLRKVSISLLTSFIDAFLKSEEKLSKKQSKIAKINRKNKRSLSNNSKVGQGRIQKKKMEASLKKKGLKKQKDSNEDSDD